MKRADILSFILFMCFLVITIAPLAYLTAPPPQLLCEDETECCMEEEDMSGDMENTDCCPPGKCNPAQCAFCCFICPATNDRIEINLYNTDCKVQSVADQFALSDFTFEYWQPPKTKTT